MLSEFVDLLIPRACGGCGCETVSLCRACVRSLDTDPISSMPRYGTVKAYGAGPYEGVMRNVLVNYKEHGRRDLGPVLGLMLARAIASALDDAPVSSAPVLVVPVPARATSARKRGGNHVEVLARNAAGHFIRDGFPLRVAPVLAVRGRGDQVGSGAHGRRRNVRGTHRISHPEVVARWPRDVRVIIVDDIVTTGATVAESARVLRESHIDVTAVASVGITGSDNRNCEENREE
mgnify:FL=1